MSYLPQGADLSTVVSVAQAASKIADDPHLSEMVCQVERLSSIEEGRPIPPPCLQVPFSAGKGKGIGLRYAVVPVRALVKVREKPWIAYAIGGGIIAAIFSVGFIAGKSRRRREAVAL